MYVASKKKLGLFTVAMINVVIVGNLQMMTANAVYGYGLLFFYLLATLTFFIPCMLLVSELSTAHPITGGAYVWVEKAFGKRWGFFTAAILWLCNLIWYPTIFTLIATFLAYLISPDLANNKLYIFVSVVSIFWGITLLNLFGIRISSLVSSVSGVLGVLLPVALLIGFGISWMSEGKPSPISLNWHSFWPNWDLSQLAFLTQVIIGLTGIEMSAVHAGDIVRPWKTLPRAFALSAIFILIVVVGAPLAVSLVVPAQQIGIVSGLIDALRIFFAAFHASKGLFLTLLALLLLGNLGSVTAWMISSTRTMYVASVSCKMPPLLQKTNRFASPVGVLLLEAVVFTILCGLFTLSTVADSYWLLLELGSQVALIYYLLIFAAAVKLKSTLPSGEKIFRIPGGQWSTAVLALLAGLSALLAIGVGFIPPHTGTVQESSSYPLLLGLGILLSLCFPLALLRLSHLRKD